MYRSLHLQYHLHLQYLQQDSLNFIIYNLSSIFFNHIIIIHFHCFFLYKIKLVQNEVGLGLDAHVIQIFWVG
jgi:hypothetical protein